MSENVASVELAVDRDAAPDINRGLGPFLESLYV